jgi:hypothetical protein
MKSENTMRAPRPRLVGGPAGEMTEAMWQRLGELPARLKARDEAYRRKMEERFSWLPPYTPADEAAEAYFKTHKYRTLGVEFASRFLRIPVRALLKATRGQAFLLDFGRSHTGDRLRYFVYRDLVRFVKAHRRAAKTPASLASVA